MRKLLAGAAALVSAAVAGTVLFVSAPQAAEAYMADQYWGCDAGYTFRVKSNAAHCYKAASVQVAAMMPCPNLHGVGLFPMVDRVGNKDMCSGTNPVSGELAAERACPVNYTKRIVAGPDRCERTVPAEVRQPTRIFVL